MLQIRREISHFEDALAAVATPARAAGEKRYLKSDLCFLGATKPDVRRIVRAWLQLHPKLSRSDLLRLTLALWKRRVHERFVRYADRMLDEREFFIRKAIGWILRETSKKNPEEVAAFLESRLARTSGVTFREAVTYLPARWASALKRKRGAGAKAGAR